MIIFHVQGSARLPYKLTAEGRGSSFRVYCTCPAGARGGQFCKHAAALIMGDVTNLAGPSGDVEELRRMAEGSPLLGKAIMHIPKAPPADAGQDFQSLDDVMAAYRKSLEAAGWEIVHQILDGERPRRAVQLFRPFKNGKLPKHPSVELFWEKLTYDLIEQADGSFVEGNVRLRDRPWGVRVKGGGSRGSWKYLSRAVPTFLKESGLDRG